jgi:hypothetical protein
MTTTITQQQKQITGGFDIQQLPCTSLEEIYINNAIDTTYDASESILTTTASSTNAAATFQ